MEVQDIEMTYLLELGLYVHLRPYIVLEVMTIIQFAIHALTSIYIYICADFIKTSAYSGSNCVPNPSILSLVRSRQASRQHKRRIACSHQLCIKTSSCSHILAQGQFTFLRVGEIKFLELGNRITFHNKYQLMLMFHL